MSPTKKITVEGVGGVKLSSDAALDKWLGNKGVECLLDEEGDEVVDFESLVHDRTYTLGPPLMQQQLQQEQQQQEKKRRLEDLLFYHRSTIETGTTKSSKLAKVKKLEDGSTRCFLCGTSGSPKNKIEASHVLHKQDIYATGGEEALLAFDTLKNWSAGFGWKRPFKIHDPMNLIWLCHAHNLAFDRHEFGLSLGGLDNSVVFFSCLDEYAQLVADANARLADPAQPFYDMSYVSRRAIGMRICKAQRAGHFNQHSNPDAWETVVALSAAASLKHEKDSDDEAEGVQEE